jgi:hypothetical protein
MPEVHRQCAAVIIQNDKGEILFLEQQNGVYGIPGGIVDPGETPPMAALREAFEEACIQIEFDYIIGTYLLTGGGRSDILQPSTKRGLPKEHQQQVTRTKSKAFSGVTRMTYLHRSCLTLKQQFKICLQESAESCVLITAWELCQPSRKTNLHSLHALLPSF